MNALGRHLDSAMKSLMARKIRSLLSMTGLVIGIAAAVLTASALRGLERRMLDQYSAVGVDILYLQPDFESGPSGGLPAAALARLAALPLIEEAFAPLSAQRPARGPRGAAELTAIGVPAGYFAVHAAKLLEGRAFTEEESRARAPVAVLGEDAAKALFGPVPAIGRSFRFGSGRYRVVGVAAKPERPVLSPGPHEVYLTRAALARLVEAAPAQSVELWLRPGSGARARDALQASLERPSEYAFIDPKAELPQARRAARTLQLYGLCLSAVSLLVGGIGLANVLLASVAERTREVGLRQALGARPDDIRFLFLVESAALGLAGGIGGVLAGLLAGLAVPLVTGGAMQADPHPAHLAAALAFAVATGLAFGAYPAVKASRLAPADALRAQG